MPHYKYAIVGGGMTADAAVRGIRSADAGEPIIMFSLEADPPYNRPPLTKGLWKGKPLPAIFRKTESRGVDLRLGRRIVSLDPEHTSIRDDEGTTYTFDKLLLATGGAPRRLPFGGDNIIYYRTVADYRRLRELTEQHGRFAVIGGGFIGSEIAASLTATGKKVTMIVPEGTIGSRIFPAPLARFVADFFVQKGVEIVPGHSVTGLEQRGDQSALKLKETASGAEREVVADAVIAGIGIQPATDLAREAGLTVDNGIVVDSYLRTNHPSIFAAGDVASFLNPALGARLRVEHEDNANTMGVAAGQAMAGNLAAYEHLPFFYSDLFELGYEAVGELDPRLETVADWKEENREGVIYYLKEGRVRGVLLWNVWEQVPAARRLIAEPGPFSPSALRSRLPE